MVGVSAQSNRPSRSLTLERAEHEDPGPDAGRPQRGALLDVGAGQQVGARVLERARDWSGPVAVRVGLDDRNDAAAARRPRLEPLDDRR